MQSGVRRGFSVSANGRHLLRDGRPWLPNVAAGAWFAIQAVSDTDSSSFFDTLAAAGFNCAHVSLIANDTDRYGSTSGNHFAAPNWNNGSTVAPFSTPGDFSTFATTYKTHARGRVDYMLSKGLIPILAICYPGYLGDSGSSGQGWADEMAADTNAHMTTYGAAAETLFSDVRELMWTIGGDVALTPSSTIESRSLAVATGVQSVNTGRLWMAHLGGSNTGLWPYEQANIAAIPGMLWSMYRYADDAERAWWGVEQAYAHSPTRPALVLDPAYEGDPGPAGYMDRTRLRQRTHSTMCSGAASVAYSRGDDGDGLAWYEMATASWTTTKPGLADHQIAYDFWSALPWWTMEPDLTSTYTTAGRGTHSSTSDDYVTVRASTACLAAYFQPGSTNTITVDLSQFTGPGAFSGAGSRRARWFDPVDGSYTAISTYSTSGTQNFQNSASNNASGTTNDRLLVID